MTALRSIAGATLTGALLCAALNSGAQPGPGSIQGDVPLGEPNIMILQNENPLSGLREQVADPEQRRQAIAVRAAAQRLTRPDFARVLGIDAELAERLLALLGEQELDRQLRAESPGRGGSAVMLEDEIQEYDAQMSQIAALIGEARLDAYLEYENTLGARLQVYRFNRSLPPASRLTDAQQDTLVALVAEAEPRRMQWWIQAGNDSPPPSGRPRDAQREALLYNIRSSELMARNMAMVDRELVTRLQQFLTPEQTRAYAAQQAAQVSALRARAQQQRRKAGLGPNELIEPGDFAPAPAAPANVRLELMLRTGGQQLTQTVISARGAPVSATGPDGLRVELQPAQLAASKALQVELKFYEAGRAAPRLIGRSTSYALIANPQPPEPINTTLLRGRRARVLEWSVTPSVQ